MGVLENIANDLKEAMKAKDTFRLGVIRLIKTEVKNKEIELMKALSESDFNAVLSRMVKQRQDSIAQFQQAGQAERAENESKEIQIIQDYLPKPLTKDEVIALIKDAISKTGAEGAKGMGLVMKEIKEATTGRFDGKELADLVKTTLAS